jgi:WD40 repeat protein
MMKQITQFALLLHVLLFNPALQAQDSLEQNTFVPKLMAPIGHSNFIHGVRFSPDEKYVITSSGDNTAKVWDLNSRKVVMELYHTRAGVFYSEFSPDGKFILTAPVIPNAKIWDAKSGQEIRELTGHTGSINSARHSQDGKYIVTASSDSTAKVWNAFTGEEVLALKGHTQKVYSAQFSPDQQLVLTASADSTAKVWNVSSGKEILEFRGHANRVYSALFSPNGKLALTASTDGTAKIWNVKTGLELATLAGHTGAVWSALFSPDGTQIITTSSDSTAKIWDVHTGKEILTLKGHTGSVRSAQFSANGRRIVTTGLDETTKMWDALTGRMLFEMKGYTAAIPSFSFSPDKQKLVIASWDHTAKVLDLKKGIISTVLQGHHSNLTSAQYSPDGKYIATASWDLSARVWDAHSGKELLELSGHHGSVRSALYSPDGAHIVTASWDSTAMVWNALTGENRWLLDEHTNIVGSAKYSPDGKQIVTTSWDRTAIIWDAHTGKKHRVLEGHNGSVMTANYSPDGSRIVTVSLDKTAKVWSALTGQEYWTLTGHKGYLYSAYFCLNGNHIITRNSDQTGQLWDADSGAEILEFKTKRDFKLAAKTCPNVMQSAVANSFNSSLKFFEADSLTEAFRFFPIDTSDWVVIHPSGLFDASPGAMDKMYYLVGREIIELEQLKERYYEPGLFQRVMAQDGRGLRDVKKFESLEMYPEVLAEIKNDTLNIHLIERNGGIGKVSLFINSKEVQADVNPERNTALTVDLTQFEKFYRTDTFNRIGIRAYNAEGWLKSQRVMLEYAAEFVHRKGQQGVQPLVVEKAHQPKYYAIVIGTSDYSGTQLDLNYADKDSKDMAHALGQTAEILFGTKNVQVNWFSTSTLSSAQTASKENIKAAFDSIANAANPEDVLVVYLSGHGVTFGGLENEQFYYLTKDVYSGDLSDPAIRKNYAMSTEELTQWVNAIPAQKQILILDACASGKVVEDLLAVRNVPTSQIRALDRMKDRTGMFVLAGSAADKVSYEASQFGQGLLTYSLLLGMSGAALADGGSVDVMQLFQFARDKVPEFAQDIGGIQTPTLAFPTGASSFDIGLVTEAVHIPLEEVKPVFVRSNFQEEANFEDVVGLSLALDAYLLDASAAISSKGAIFVDANQFKGAYSIKGRYLLKGNQLQLQGGLFKNKEKVEGFELAGSKNDVDGLIQRIITEVNRILNQ